MRLIILSILFGIMLLIVAFDAKECQHIYVSVEQEEIKCEPIRPMNLLGTVSPVGIQQGKELVCVKCFHIIRQKLDFGESAYPKLDMPTFFLNRSCDSFSFGKTFLIVDSCRK